jgi:hypothetical protein
VRPSGSSPDRNPLPLSLHDTIGREAACRPWQLVLTASTLGLTRLGTQAGHVLAARARGVEVHGVVLFPLAISRIDVTYDLVANDVYLGVGSLELALLAMDMGARAYSVLRDVVVHRGQVVSRHSVGRLERRSRDL